MPMSHAYSHWLTPHKARLPAALADWLQDTGSLTARLKAHSQQTFSVKVQNSGWQKANIDEARTLHIDRRQRVYCREVCLLDGQQPRVFARTIVPLASYPTLRMGLSRLGNASLGQWLFNDPGVTRGPIEICRLPIDHPLNRHACQAAAIDMQSLWARRSCFTLRGKTLLVSEVFLPATEQYQW